MLPHLKCVAAALRMLARLARAVKRLHSEGKARREGVKSCAALMARNMFHSARGIFS